MSKPLVIVLGGATGLLGQSLVKRLDNNKWSYLNLDRRVCDILNKAELEKFIELHNPDIVINAIAYTQVDLAEDNKEDAFLLNKTLVQNLGQILSGSKSLLVHYSTDFIFNGNSVNPYKENDAPEPINTYGASKLAGEEALKKINNLEYLIIRSSWLFGPQKKNFVSTIVNKARENCNLKVVHDQVGSPSYTLDIAEATYNLIDNNAREIFNFTNCGEASWCELASEAIKIANINCHVQAISTSEYPTKATRPKYSVLDTTKYQEITKTNQRSWTNALKEYIFEELFAE